jgi:hypothetical protein
MNTTTQTLTIHKTREGLNNQLITLCGAERGATYLPHLAECSFHDRKSPCNCTVKVDCPDCQTALVAAQKARADRAKAVIAGREERMAQFGDDVQIFD